MKNLLNPIWLFMINTLPVIVLLILLSGQFNIIRTLLNDYSVHLWKNYMWILGISGFLNLAYTVYLIVKKQNISLLYSFLTLVGYISLVYVYGYHSYEMVPFDIPQWMMSGNVFLYVGTFLMPTIAYSLFVLVVHCTSETRQHKAWINFLISIIIPLVAYVFSQIIIPLWQPYGQGFNTHAALILMIVVALVFIFFLVRGIFILTMKKKSVWENYQLLWKVPIAILLPLLGLSVNSEYSGVFGNFDNHWFYILAIINGVLICLPGLDHKNYRLFLFIGRTITFAYTFYFFLVFLPFLPLSIIALFAVGTGFLILTPLLLFVIHVNELSKDVNYLKTFFGKKFIVGIALLGAGVIPASITVACLKEKRVLNEALDYLYAPDYSKQYDIDGDVLEKTLSVVKQQKGRNGNFIFNTNIPYLSSYFNWIVFDNLTLSEAKINYIEHVFFGNTSYRSMSETIRNKNAKITNISTNSSYDTSQNAWKSRIDLEITNYSENDWFEEYATTIDLPEGCWISDYYLYVGDRKEQGMLAEKKSAMWVFSSIRNENKDPGILYYLTGNKVAFRVFPFSQNEVRKTGIEFLHKEPVKLEIDDHIVKLGNAEETIDEKIEAENVVYVSSKQKQSLKTVKRKPYFHFLVDVSNEKNDDSTSYINRIEVVLKNNESLAENARISFVNTYVNTFPLDKNWKQNYLSQIREGGFYLERGIKNVLLDACKEKFYPVIIVVTDNIQNAVLDKDFSDFKFAFPESNLFFNLDSEGVLQPHSLTDNPLIQLPDHSVDFFNKTVLAYKLPDNSVVYLRDNNEPEIILIKDHFEISESEIHEKNWRSALMMQAKWRSQIVHPETSEKEWLSMVKYSFTSKIMMPVTSYLVVENEAQKAILKKKQKQVLSGKKSLDPDEDTQRMSEPGFWVLVIFIGLIFRYRRHKRINV